MAHLGLCPYGFYLFLLLFVYMGFFDDLTNWVNPEMLIHFWVFIFIFKFFFF